MNIQIGNTSGSYRIADGKLATGRGHGGEKNFDAIHGILKRVGVHEGNTDDGREYKMVECELDQAYGQNAGQEAESLGKVSVHAYFKDQQSSNVTAANLAAGLIQCPSGGRVAIRPAKSKTADPVYGKYTTYANVFVVSDDGRAMEVRPDYSAWPGERKKEQLPHILADLAMHPSYGARPARDEEDADDFGLSAPKEGLVNLGNICADKKWPSPKDHDGTYADLASKAIRREVKSLHELSEDELGLLCDSIKRASKVPPALAKILADDYDPFADA